jgi:hypothetical protein
MDNEPCVVGRAGQCHLAVSLIDQKSAGIRVVNTRENEPVFCIDGFTDARSPLLTVFPDTHLPEEPNLQLI